MKKAVKILTSLIILSTVSFTTSGLAWASGNTPHEITAPVGIAGQFMLTKASTSHARDTQCDTYIEIIVSDDEVRLRGINSETDNSFESFKFADAGCSAQHVCTRFTEGSVVQAARLPLSMAGAARTSISIRTSLFDKNKLIYSHDHTQLPFGIFGIWDDQKFECQYQRIQ